MPHLNLVERWITAATGRTLDQHAVDPVPPPRTYPRPPTISDTYATSCYSPSTTCAPDSSAKTTYTYPPPPSRDR